MNPQLAVMATIRGGVFTRADAGACGYDATDIDYLLRRGAWRRIDRTTLAPHRLLIVVGDEMLHLRRLHTLLRDGPPGLVASHQSAAALYGLPLWGLDLSGVHVTAAAGRPGRHARGVHRHVRPLPPGDLAVWNGLRLTGAARTVAEVAATAPAEAATVVVEAALRAGLVTRPRLHAAVRRIGTGRDRARRVVDGADGHSGSVGESRLRHLLRTAGLPAPSDQPPPAVFAYGEAVDPHALWFPDQRTVVEFEPWLEFWAAPGAEPAPDPFAAEPACPPVEQVWVPWPDLDQPDLVVERVRAAFARADATSGVRLFDPTRRRRRRSRVPAPPPDLGDDIPC